MAKGARINLRFDEGVLAQADAAAKHLKIDRTKFLERAARELAAKVSRKSKREGARA